MAGGAFASILVLSACREDAGTRLAAPELACLERIGSALGVIGNYDFDDPNQAREGFFAIANVMDGVDLAGCSAQSLANHRSARGSIARAQDLVSEFDRYGGSAQRLARMRAAMGTLQHSINALEAERNQRKSDYDRRFSGN